MTSHQTGPSSLRNGLVDRAVNKRHHSDEIPSFADQYIPILQPNSSQSYPSRSSPSWAPYRQQAWDAVIRALATARGGIASRARGFRLKDVLDVQLLLIIIWMLVLWWGEAVVFRQRVEDCAWGNWESWAPETTPHHVILIADPQLVDPHTYPGRPWPLSTFTIWYTDLYIRKSFQHIQKTLSPDSVIFLGDLFDGGREWSTPPGIHKGTESPDKRWRKYGQKYWLKEYRRFSHIFFDPWLRSDNAHRPEQRGRKLIAGLPGNHDLGLGGGIRVPVRNRFNAYFGEGNRIDVIGNHTFVSLDTVSLSAKGQPDVAAGSQGIGQGEDHNKEIWGPVDQFLHTVRAKKAAAIDREVRVQNGKPENEPMDHTTFDINDTRVRTMPIQTHPNYDVPSIIITHVPLYRAPGTPCGPQRERFPPSKSKGSEEKSIEKDDANAIKVQAGDQYQNVLTPAVSSEIVELVGDVAHVFSGDDHDYCEVVHREYTSKNGGIREITAKSISWAMGVRKPGFLLVSLWNPINAQGKSVGHEIVKKTTIQTHLCLLPDQLSIFVRYVWLLILTLLVVVARAFSIIYSKGSAVRDFNGHLLPVSRNESSKLKLENMDTSARSQDDGRYHSSSSSSSDPPNQNGLAARSSTGRTPRSASPVKGSGYGYPAKELSQLYSDERSRFRDSDGIEWNDNDVGGIFKQRGRTGLAAVFFEARRSVAWVASIVFVWYIWLLWNS